MFMGQQLNKLQHKSFMQGQAVNITPVWFTMKCDMYIQSVGIVCYIHWQLQVLKKNSSADYHAVYHLESQGEFFQLLV